MTCFCLCDVDLNYILLCCQFCRYCIVPFMDVPVDNKIVEYILRCSFREGTIEFDVKDLVKVRLVHCIIGGVVL